MDARILICIEESHTIVTRFEHPIQGLEAILIVASWRRET